MEVTPQGRSNPSVDIKELVDALVERGIQLPILLRFSDVLRARIQTINESFQRAIVDCDYQAPYRGVFPIKVNQSRTVIEEIVEFGAPYHFGLEAGSKPELLATIAVHTDPEALIICNGYKDSEYIRTALWATKMGKRVVLVAEKLSEVRRILAIAKEEGIKPQLGLRARLTARGAGKWKESGGDRSKFGLSAWELVSALRWLEQQNQVDTLTLLHFHLGSQISAIRSIKNGLREAARLYVELRKMGAHKLTLLDVGGGLGVDYDGSQTNFQSSMNYSVQEYANDVVHEISQVCNNADQPHPTLISESGRAIAAYHSVLITDVLETTRGPDASHPTPNAGKEEGLLANLRETFESVTRKNCIECFHDTRYNRDQALQLFNLGHLSLADRVVCDQLFYATCAKILHISQSMEHVPEELEKLPRILADTYYLNFSLFQSLPDAWAVDQLFPIVPIHRLLEEPKRRGVLADITCDSDGLIEDFVDLRDVKKVLELHEFQDGSPYYLGFFLVGAYQEILGDLHNLFGDTHTVHVAIDDSGDFEIKEVFPGDSLAKVLSYVNYAPDGLIRSVRKHAERAIREGKMTVEESRTLISRYRESLEGYTYLGNSTDRVF